MKADCLGISSKINLKVDVEMGKLIIKKAKDGPEDKFYNHKKSKWMDHLPYLYLLSTFADLGTTILFEELHFFQVCFRHKF